MKRFSSWRRGIGLALVGVIVIGAAGTALAVSSSSKPRAASPNIDPTVASMFSVFQHSATSADVLPPAFGQMLQSADSSVQPNVADSRSVPADDGQTSYLVPAAGGACVINTNESICAPDQSLPGSAAVDLCSPSLPLGQLELEWVLPDGSTNVSLHMSDGTTRTLMSGYNVYIERLPLNAQTPVPKTIAWQGPTGDAHSVNAPIPPGAQATACAHAPPAASAAGSRRAHAKLRLLRGQLVHERPRPIP
jgi:hypothetical protein